MVTKSLDLVDLSIYKRAKEPSTESSCVCKHYPGLLPLLLLLHSLNINTESLIQECQGDVSKHTH